MRMKMILLGLGILFVLAVLPGASAQEFISRVTEERVGFHSVDVFIHEDGSASIEERFFFTFFAGEATQFEEDFAENNPSLSAWKQDYPFIHPHMGLENNASGIEFFLNRTANGEPTLTMTYEYPRGLVEQVKVGTQGRSTRWKLSEIALVQYIFGGTIAVPENTQIKFHLPAGAVVDTTLLPQGVNAIANLVTLTNFQSNAFRLEYVVLTPIADPIDVGKVVDGLIRSPLFAVVLAIIALSVMYIALNQERIRSQVEDYVIEHSEFKPAQKKEIEMDWETDEKGSRDG